MAEILTFPHVHYGGQQQTQWRITRIRGSRAEHLGVLEAPDAESAIAAGIRQFGVTDPEQQKRIAAYRLR